MKDDVTLLKVNCRYWVHKGKNSLLILSFKFSPLSFDIEQYRNWGLGDNIGDCYSIFLFPLEAEGIERN